MSAVAPILKIHQLEADGLVHGFSTLALGNVGLSHAPDPAPVMASRRDFARALGLDRLTIMGAVHGSALPESTNRRKWWTGSMRLSPTRLEWRCSRRLQTVIQSSFLIPSGVVLGWPTRAGAAPSPGS